MAFCWFRIELTFEFIDRRLYFLDSDRKWTVSSGPPDSVSEPMLSFVVLNKSREFRSEPIKNIDFFRMIFIVVVFLCSKFCIFHTFWTKWTKKFCDKDYFLREEYDVHAYSITFSCSCIVQFVYFNYISLVKIITWTNSFSGCIVICTDQMSLLWTNCMIMKQKRYVFLHYYSISYFPSLAIQCL